MSRPPRPLRQTDISTDEATLAPLGPEPNQAIVIDSSSTWRSSGSPDPWPAMLIYRPGGRRPVEAPSDPAGALPAARARRLACSAGRPRAHGAHGCRARKLYHRRRLEQGRGENADGAGASRASIQTPVISSFTPIRPEGYR